MPLITVILVTGPKGAVIVPFEIDDIGALALGKITLSALQSLLLGIVIELPRPVLPDAPDTEIDHQGNDAKQQNTQSHGGTRLETKSRPVSAIFESGRGFVYHTSR